jgi:hypothetical protein
MFGIGIGIVFDGRISRLRAMISQTRFYRNNEKTDEETGRRT